MFCMPCFLVGAMPRVLVKDFKCTVKVVFYLTRAQVAIESNIMHAAKWFGSGVLVLFVSVILRKV